MSQDDRRPPAEAYFHHRAFVGQPQRYDVAAAPHQELHWFVMARDEADLPPRDRMRALQIGPPAW